jgi:hypothetical protein
MKQYEVSEKRREDEGREQAIDKIVCGQIGRYKLCKGHIVWKA